MDETSGNALSGTGDAQSSVRDSLRQLAFYRNIAVAGQITTVAALHFFFQVRIALLPVALIIGSFALANLVVRLHLASRRPVGTRDLFGHIVFDLTIFTLLLYFTGGATNPFAGLYLLPLVIAAMTLPTAHAWAAAAVTAAGYSVLVFFHLPLLDAGGEPVRRELLAAGAWINYLLSAGLIVFFVVKISASLREHARLLAEARMAELRNEGIVRAGTLAASAAHEFSTPLSTMAVVIKELTREFGEAPELKDYLAVLRTQLQACKNTLSCLVASAGHTRLEGEGSVALDEFLAATVEKFRRAHPGVNIQCHIEGWRPAPTVVSEQTLRQAIMNLLDNAADVSPQHVGMNARWNDRELCIEIRDEGKGIPPEMLNKIGRTFFTTKAPGKGNGLGLVLTYSIINSLGGRVNFSNRAAGGASMELRLPLPPLLSTSHA